MQDDSVNTEKPFQFPPSLFRYGDYLSAPPCSEIICQGCHFHPDSVQRPQSQRGWDKLPVSVHRISYLLESVAIEETVYGPVSDEPKGGVMVMDAIWCAGEERCEQQEVMGGLMGNDYVGL